MFINVILPLETNRQSILYYQRNIDDGAHIQKRFRSHKLCKWNKIN